MLFRRNYAYNIMNNNIFSLFTYNLYIYNLSNSLSYRMTIASPRAPSYTRNPSYTRTPPATLYP